MPSSLIIGGSGQDGYFLSLHLLKNGHITHSAQRTTPTPKQQLLKSLRFHIFQSYSYDSFNTLIKEYDFDYIYLIASAVGNKLARSQPTYVYETNISIVSSLAKVLLENQFCGRLVYFSTSDIVGIESSSPYYVTSTCFTTTSTPITTYGLSKFHASDYLRFLRISYGLNVSNFHLMMHESGLRTGDYLLSRVKSFIRNPTNEATPLTGNLNINVDLSSATAMMEAVYLASTAQSFPSDLVIGSGVYTKFYDLIANLLLFSGHEPSIMLSPACYGSATYHVCADTKDLHNIIGCAPPPIQPRDIIT